MASVWAGMNESTGKLVALKVIRPEVMTTPGAEAFLKSEGLVASRINHPNVVNVFDVVEQDGMVAIVMELLDGLPLGTYISRHGPLGIRDAVSLLLPAMRGVAAAHAQGVVHRDLKPQNIFVCIGPDARIVTTKVLDFGISLMVDWARGNSVAAMPGLVGTPSYMAPEHIEGSTVLDPRTDVYGFGLLFYEALSGRMAFTGDSGTDLLKQVLTQSPVPLRELCHDLPMGFIAVIDTAMAKRPEQRFGGLNEMVHALEEQMAQAAPLPALTPASGVPTAMSYAVSSSVAIAIPTNIGRESSEPILKTQIFGRAMGQEAEPQGGRLEPGDDSGRPAPVHGVVDVGVPTELLSPRVRWFIARLRDRRVQIGAGVAVLPLILVAWAAWPSSHESRARSAPASHLTAPARAPVVVPTPDPPVVLPLPAQADNAATPAASDPVAPGEAEPPSPPPAAAREAPARPARGAAAKGKSAASAARPPKRSTLRAGSLSESDF
jgi:eukaryotic-like serine/threonine-protein kinase